MGERNVDLSDTLLSSKLPVEPWSAKDDVSGGNDDGKVLMGFSDDSKDQVTSESSIPLSPQWLYSKPNESRAGLLSASGDMHAQNSLSQGNPVDLTQKEGGHVDGSQDKKDWRRNAPETEIHRWREEERETSLLGRRDRRKEADEYRKSDRRSDSASVREASESRVLPLSDRWHDVTSRSSGHESRRDSKWSSRWGPEDKDKDCRTDKKADLEKEDSHNEKQSLMGGNHVASERETDSRDKWRPRHRQEVHSGGSAVYRAAPGFGLERGRVEGSNVGFAPGRGRSNIFASVSYSRPSYIGPIGATPAYKNERGLGKSDMTADTFCYPRGKLLDIYRKHKLSSSFGSIPDGFEEVPPMTQVSCMEPLAFVAPDADEESILECISKGKLNSSDEIHNSKRDETGKDDNKETGAGSMTLSESKHGMLPASNLQETGEVFGEAANNIASHSNGCFDGYAFKMNPSDTGYNLGEHENKVTIPYNRVDSGGLLPALLSKGNSIVGPCANQFNTVHRVSETDNLSFEQADISSSFKHQKPKDVDAVAYSDMHKKLPDDSNSLIDPLSPHNVYSDDQCVKSNGPAKLSRVVQPGELSLVYQDPQGKIQGPFLGVDIISWFEQGFFGTDLPVCPSNARQGTPFQELGELMPELKLKAQALFGSDVGNKFELPDTTEGKLEASVLASDFVSSSSAMNEQQWAFPDLKGHSDDHVLPKASKHEDSVEPHYARLPPTSDSETFASLLNSEKRNFHEFMTHDNEEVFSARPGSSSGNPLGKRVGSFHDSLQNPARHIFLESKGETAIPNHELLNGNNLHPFNLSWSELENLQLKRSQSTNMSSGIGHEEQLGNTLMARGATLSHRQKSFSALADSPIIGENLSDGYRRNTITSSNLLHNAMDANHMSGLEHESNRFDLADCLLSQQLQKQHFQHNILATSPSMHLNKSFLEQLPSSANHLNSIQPQSTIQPVPDLEHLKLQFQQQRHFELQQQHHLQQRQQQLHQMQLQQQQQFQVQQLFLEQFINQRMHDPGFLQPQIDPLRSGNMLDEVIFRQKLLHNLQQNSHISQRHHDLFLEQLIQAKIGQGLPLEKQKWEIPSNENCEMLPIEQQLLLDIQREQMQARQFAVSRQRQAMEEHRHMGEVWSVDESGQLVRAAANPYQTQASGFSPLDFYTKHQRPSYEPSNLEQNLAFHEQLQRGLYEPSGPSFDRLIPLDPGDPGMSMDLVSHIQGLDIRERQAQMPSAGQMESFPSATQLHHHHISNNFHTSHLDAVDSSWSECQEQPPNSWRESRIHQLQLEADWKSSRDLEGNITSGDPSSWGSSIGNGDKSKPLLDLLQKFSPSNQSLELGEGASSYDRREPSWTVSASSPDHIQTLPRGQGASGVPFAGGLNGLNLRHAATDQLVNMGIKKQATGMESCERLPLRSHSGVFIEDEQFLPVRNEEAHTIYSDLNVIGKPSMDGTISVNEQKGLKWISRNEVGNKAVTEVQVGRVSEQPEITVLDHSEVPVNNPTRHASFGSAGSSLGLYNCEMGTDIFIAKDRMPAVISRGNDDSLPKRSIVSEVLSSQESLSKLPFTPTSEGKHPVNFAGSDGGRRELLGNPAPQVAESDTAASGKKEMRFHRTSSYGDAEVSGTSFMDMLKSTKKPAPEVDVATGFLELDVSQASRSNKKKGKKGRQIDPTLLGFKVSSNRIMMGEIHRLDD